MREYLIQSAFGVGDEVCFVGDGVPSDRFGLVMGFTLEGNNTYINVSYGGSEDVSVFENQLEFRVEREARELINGND